MNTLPTRTGCSACGTSLVNHHVIRTLNIVDGGLDKVRKTLAPFLPSLPNEKALADRVFRTFNEVLGLVGIMRFSSDQSKALSGRSELIWSEAARRGIRMEQLVVVGKYLEQYRAKIGGKWFYFTSIPVPPWSPQADYAWIDDKLELAHRLHVAQIPAPQARLASSWADTLRGWRELSKPIIVKPRFGSRSRHTTTHITTEEELRTAFVLAKQIAHELVLEEHLFGSVCRATLVGGKLVGFFKADPPQVTGDGEKSIAALIAEKNTSRPEKIGAIEINDDLTSFIARKGYVLESVLPRGLVLDLSAKTGRFYGGYTREMLSEIHPKLREIFERVGELIKAPVLGFDLICADPAADPDTLRWGIIECNSLPFIDLHYYAFHGAPNDIAPHIWDLWSNPT